MFLTKNDLGSTIYEYQIDQITEGDENIINHAIEAAISEVKSYLTGNHKTEWLDGRLRYDIEAIFLTTGTDRNALILGHTKTVAKWWLVELCNADVIYEQAKERYDRSTAYLKQLARGDITLNDLPTIDTNSPTNTDVQKEPFRFGSRKKFNHE